MNTNVAIVTGNLTKEPELRTTTSGKAVATLRVAVNRMQDKGTDFINVTVWNGAAEACAQYLTKGSPVAVTGSIRTGEYVKQDGTKGYSFEISAQRVEFLNRRDGAPSAVAPSTDRPVDAATASDDDIPF